MSLNRGSTQPLLTQTDLKSQPILLPLSPALDGFHRFTQFIYSRVDKSENESLTLAQLRDTLLPKLISGELRITDAEKFIERTGI